MRARAPHYRERRGEQVLLVWGEAPFWAIMDREADRLVADLVEGKPLAPALERLGNRAGVERGAARLLTSLRRAGVIGRKRVGRPRERIESIAVNITNRCNLSCAFCYNRGRGVDGKELSAERMIGELEGMRRWTVRGAPLAMLGGEPLLEPEKVLTLAAWARRRRLTPVLSTNGLLVTDEFAGQAARLGLECQVSIDGAGPEAHDAVRGSGSFERAVAGVRTLVRSGVHTIVSMVFHAGNVAEIPAYLRMARELRVAEARFIPLKALGGGGGFDPAEPAGVVRMVAELVAAEPELGRLLGRDYVSILARTCRSCAPRQGCGTGSQTFLLDAGGTVYPCVNLAQPEMAVGDVRDGPLRRIWRESPRLGEIRREVALESRQACRACWARHWCLGGCRGEVYARTGTLNGPGASCVQSRAAVVEAFWALSRCPGLLRTGPEYCLGRVTMRFEYEGVMEAQPTYQHVGYLAAASYRVASRDYDTSAIMGFATVGLVVTLLAARHARRLPRARSVALAAAGLALLAGAAVWAMRADVTWERYYPNPYWQTSERIGRLSNHVEAHRERTGELPATLPQMRVDRDETGTVEDSNLDAWGRAFRYERLQEPDASGRGYRISSAGADGIFGSADDIAGEMPLEETLERDKAYREAEGIAL